MGGSTRALPTGEVTFVFTDIEGSTILLRTLGDDEYDALLRQHNEVLVEAVQRAGGEVVHLEGDSCFAAFASADDALTACLAAQADLHSRTWPRDVDVRVRMGIHSGLAQPRNDDYAALAVHQAVRLMSAASGGQVFVSATTVAVLDQPHRFDLRSLGPYRIRDFDEPVTIHAAYDGRWPHDPRPPRARPAEGHNIDRPSTSLHGRDRELDAVGTMIEPGALVSLVGPGGVGKTRLAIEIARSQLERWPDGVWFVNLDSLSSPEQVTGAIISAARGDTPHSTDPSAALVESLATRSSLLILDNCEHVLDECARSCSALLSASSTIGILATSRTPLGLTAEHVWRLDPLATASAVRLFFDRAESGGSFAATARDDPGAVTELCRRLDGLPLAIELAAANAHRTSIDGLIGVLQRSDGLATRRDASIPERHRSLDDVLSWGYRLLTPREQLVARRLSVFPAAFDASTARAATGLDDIESDLASLVDSSFVGIEADDGGIRYRQLTTVRAALGSALPDAERSGVMGRTIDHFVATIGPTAARDRTWIGNVGSDLDNVRAMVAVREADAVDAQQQLAWVICRYLDITDQFSLAVVEAETMLATLVGATPARVSLECVLADARLRVGDVAGARSAVDTARALYATVGAPAWDDVCIARTTADIALRSQDIDLALETVRNALEASPSSLGAARLWNLAGVAHATRDHLPDAIVSFEREYEEWTRAGDSARAAVAESNLAEAMLRVGDEVGAATHQLRSLDHAITFGKPLPCAFAMIVVARILVGRGRFTEAIHLQGVADRLLAENRFALYDTDIAERAAMLDRVTDELGGTKVSELLTAGAAADVGEAVSTTATVLRELIDEGAGHV